MKNRCLNFFKGLACIGVVFGHAKFPGMFGDTVVNCILWSVPVFYMISGYYSYSADGKSLRKIPRKLKNIFNITVVSLGIYFLLSVMYELVTGNLLEWFKNNFTISNIFSMLIINDFEFVHAPHLWFLPSLLYCYCILYIAINSKKIKYIYYLIPIIYIIRVLIVYVPGYDWHYKQNVFLGAISNFFLGYYIASNKKILDKVNSNTLISIIIACLITIIIGSIYELDSSFFELMTIPLSISIFFFAQKNPKRYILGILEKIGVKYSLVIYIVHMIVLEVVVIVFAKLFPIKHSIYGYMIPIVILFVTLILAKGYYYVIGRLKRNSFRVT